MATIFSKIVAGDIPSYKIAEDNDFFAFLDINPVQPGHVLVIPKREEDYIFDMRDDELAALMIFAKKIANIIKEKLNCSRVAMSVIGMEVPHVHIHLIPINSEKDLDFTKKQSLSADDFLNIQQILIG